MIKIGILGDIGSGKTFVANQFGYPVFSADREVVKIYKNNKKCFNILKKNFPNYIFSFPISKGISKITIFFFLFLLMNFFILVRTIGCTILFIFFKFVLFDNINLENKIKKKDFTLVFVDAKKKEIVKNLKKRKNYNSKIIKLLKRFQMSLNYKKRISNYIIRNNFKMNPVKKSVKLIKNRILYK